MSTKTFMRDLVIAITSGTVGACCLLFVYGGVL